MQEDFAGAAEFFAGSGSRRWAELDAVLTRARVHLQPSDQAGKRGIPIFDPKGTNRELTELAHDAGWNSVPVPDALTEFGVDWDSGKGTVLAEWQFSNYPFLWNNIIRTQGVFASQTPLIGMSGIEALVIVTKSGIFPASNSTLYFEQARAQINAVMSFAAFTVPIRLVGLTVPPHVRRIECEWTTYAGRYARVGVTETREFAVEWGRAGRKYGHEPASFIPLA